MVKTVFVVQWVQYKYGLFDVDVDVMMSGPVFFVLLPERAFVGGC